MATVSTTSCNVPRRVQSDRMRCTVEAAFGDCADLTTNGANSMKPIVATTTKHAFRTLVWSERWCDVT